MVSKFHIDEADAAPEFGMACQRLLGESDGGGGPPFGAMACFLAPGGSSEPDCHDEEEAMIVLSGRGEVDVAGEMEALAPNDVVVFPSNRQHTVHNSGEQTLVWVSLYWPPIFGAP